MSTVQIHLVRHGQSTWNVRKILQGATAHPPLTERGVEQAKQAAETLAECLGPVQDVSLFTSDLTRAVQTAHAIADRCGLSARPAVELREQALGELEGKHIADLQSEPTPPGRHVAEMRWGGGESLQDVDERLRRFFNRELTPSPADIVVVSHGDTIRVALAVLAGRTHREVDWAPVENGSVTTVEFDRARLPL